MDRGKRYFFFAVVLLGFFELPPAFAAVFFAPEAFDAVVVDLFTGAAFFAFAAVPAPDFLAAVLFAVEAFDAVVVDFFTVVAFFAGALVLEDAPAADFDFVAVDLLVTAFADFVPAFVPVAFFCAICESLRVECAAAPRKCMV